MAVLVNTTTQGVNISGTANCPVTSGFGGGTQTGGYASYANVVTVAGTTGVQAFEFSDTNTGYVWIVTATAHTSAGQYGGQRIVARNFTGSGLRSTTIASGNATSTTVISATTANTGVRISQGGTFSGTKVYSVFALRLI